MWESGRTQSRPPGQVPCRGPFHLCLVRRVAMGTTERLDGPWVVVLIGEELPRRGGQPAKGPSPPNKCSYSKPMFRFFIRQALSKFLLCAEHGTKLYRTQRYQLGVLSHGVCDPLGERKHTHHFKCYSHKEGAKGGRAPTRMADKEFEPHLQIPGRGVDQQGAE